MEKYKHLTDLDLADSYDELNEIHGSILIGLDYYYSFVENAVRTGEFGPVAQKSIFGWILCGCYDSDKPINEPAVRFIITHCLRLASETQSDNENHKKPLNHLVSKFFGIESLGVFEENAVTKKFEKNLSFNGSIYL